MSNAITTTTGVEDTDKNIGNLQGQVNGLVKEIKGAIQALKEQSEVLNDDDFWALMEEFKATLKRYKMDNTEKAAHSFIHSIVWGHYKHGIDEDNRSVALRFVKTYRASTKAIYKPLFDVISGYGDDGYGDILDSFPLFGRERYEKALEGKLEGDSKAQYQGENYVAMSLDNAIYELYAMSCRNDYAYDSPGTF